VVLEVVTIKQRKQRLTVRTGRHGPPPRSASSRLIDGESRDEPAAINERARESTKSLHASGVAIGGGRGSFQARRHANRVVPSRLELQESGADSRNMLRESAPDS
jgi:hypothetical protein